MARPKKEKPNRSDGRYEVKITVGKNLDGSLIRKTFYSNISKEDARKQAEAYKIESQVAERSGIGFVSKEVGFSEWASKWLDTYKKGKVKEHTYLFTYKSNVENYLIPYFKTANLSIIKQADIQNYFNKHSHLAKSTLDKHKLILADIFDKAIYNDLCSKNPVRDIVISNKTKKERPYWNKEESDRAVDYAKQFDNNAAIGIVIMLSTGIRRSELIGLQWSDIDFHNNTIHIQRSVVPTTGKLVESDTKSESSNRIIPISAGLAKYLINLNRKGNYVLCNQNGDMLSPNTFAQNLKNFMVKLCEDLNLQALTPHELRHTFGTVLREKNVDIYTIQKLMGHADISITAKTYVHNDIEILRKSMKLEQ